MGWELLASTNLASTVGDADSGSVRPLEQSKAQVGFY